jgi:hypothetical protein
VNTGRFVATQLCGSSTAVRLDRGGWYELCSPRRTGAALFSPGDSNRWRALVIAVATVGLAIDVGGLAIGILPVNRWVKFGVFIFGAAFLLATIVFALYAQPSPSATPQGWRFDGESRVLLLLLAVGLVAAVGAGVLEPQTHAERVIEIPIANGTNGTHRTVIKIPIHGGNGTHGTVIKFPIGNGARDVVLLPIRTQVSGSLAEFDVFSFLSPSLFGQSIVDLQFPISEGKRGPRGYRGPPAGQAPAALQAPPVQ